MRLPKYAIDNHQFTLMIFIMLLVAGVSSYFTMPRTENPSMVVSAGTVSVIYPGASPGDLEELVAIPIEEAINELDDLKRVETIIRDGFVSITAEFQFGTDPKEKYNDLVTKVDDIKGDLPGEIYALRTTRWSTTDVNRIQLAVTSSTAEYYELEDAAWKLKKDLERVNGILRVDIYAAPSREVVISLDLEKMMLMNISIDMVENALRSSNANIPGGMIDIGNRTFAVNTSGSYKGLEEIRNTVINSHQGQLIYLSNIADVAFDYESSKYMARYNGVPAVFVAAGQKDKENIFDIMDQVYPLIEKNKNELNDNIELHMVLDQSVFVGDRVNVFLSNLIQGIFLVGLLILLALGFKPALIVIVAIPLAFLTGIGFVDMAGFGLQQVSIAGLVVALGLLVDNSIVVVENINRFLKNGHSPREAAWLGTRQIGWPVTAATVTTLLAFIPLILMNNDAGEFIKSLPVTLIATLTMSLLIALTITPLAASFILRKPVKRSFSLNNMLERIIEGPYRRLLVLVLRNKSVTLFIAVAALGISVFVFTSYVGESFFPKAELPHLMIRIEMPEGTNIEKTDQAVKYVESVLLNSPLVHSYASNIGHGNPRIYYNMMARNYSSNFGEIYVRLKEYDTDQFNNFIRELRKTFSTFPGGTVTIREFEQGTPVQAPVVIDIKGDEADILLHFATDIERVMHQVPGLINIENLANKRKTDLHVNINRDKAAYFGVPLSDIDRTIRTCVNGTEVSRYRDSRGKEYAIVMRLDVPGDMGLERFDQIYVNSLAGNFIPLGQLTSVEFREVPSIIIRKGLMRTATILADIDHGYTLDQVLSPITETLESYELPPGYWYTVGGELENREESFGGMFKAVIIALIAIFAVLVLQFRSFLQPLIMFVSIPLAFIGSIWALFITGNTFSFTAFIGLISLVGIVINNAIILVDYTNKLIAEGKSLDDAIHIACETRFTPIILTTLTTIGGLLPLTLGGGTLWAPMGWGIIGGLITSTALTLLVVPILYHLVFKTQLKLEKSVQGVS
jgi:multidrug efflux pump subunit AcrB